MSANINVPGGRDTIGHSSVQGWSAGDIFPATIAVVEHYDDYGDANNAALPLAARLLYRCFELTLDGVSRRYVSHADAALVGRALVSDAAARRAWREEE
jgi:hypothetical protein